MRTRIETEPESPEEVIIRCHAVTPSITALLQSIEQQLNGEMLLYLGDTEYYVPLTDVLFFETAGSKVAAHTASKMLYTDKKLYELERSLPACFLRVSKGAILNTSKITSVTRGLTGIGEVAFAGSYKKTFVSRMYLKKLKEIIYETRLKK